VNRELKIILAAGGTGGHLFPAQGLAHELIQQVPAASLLFVGGGLETNPYFQKNQFASQDITVGTLPLRRPIQLMKGLSSLFKGIYQCIKIIDDFKPDLVIGFGSFHTIPPVLAAKIKGIPILLHEGNSIPGQANRWLAPLASCIGVHFPSTRSFFKGKVFEVGMPLRSGFHKEAVSQKSSRDYFNLHSSKTTVLIFGGSQGAKALNQLVLEALPYFKGENVQFIHLIGSKNSSEEFVSRYREFNLTASVKPFETEMEKAWAAADFFIGRAGASTLAECMEFEKPGILIPYPYATNLHQNKNAEFLVNTVKGGVMWLEQNVTTELLSHSIHQFLNPDHLAAMQKNIQMYQRRVNRLTLSQLIISEFTKRNGTHE